MEAVATAITVTGIGLLLGALQLAADIGELLNFGRATISIAIVGTIEIKEAIINITTAGTNRIEAAAVVDIDRIKVVSIAASIALAATIGRTAITFYLYYKNLNYFAT